MTDGQQQRSGALANEQYSRSARSQMVRRSPAITSSGRIVRVAPSGEKSHGTVHLAGTIRASAPHQAARGRTMLSGSTSRRDYVGPQALRIEARDVRRAIIEGRESHLVLFCVDASMAAGPRMRSVKSAVVSLLQDAYQGRDKVGLVTFRGAEAALTLPPTSSVVTAVRRLEVLPTGGLTPLAEGLLMAEQTLRLERIRNPQRRALLIIVTDGRATAGPNALDNSRRAAEYLATTGVEAIVVDRETGKSETGPAASLARMLDARYVALEEGGTAALVSLAGGTPATTEPSGRAQPGADNIEAA